jgi:hypothetical protein
MQKTRTFYNSNFQVHYSVFRNCSTYTQVLCRLHPDEATLKYLREVSWLGAHNCASELDRFLQWCPSLVDTPLCSGLAKANFGFKPRTKHNLCMRHRDVTSKECRFLGVAFTCIDDFVKIRSCKLSHRKNDRCRC